MRGNRELTPREIEILNLVKLGSGNKEIASKLGLTIGTIKVYLRDIFLRLGAENRTDAIVKAHRAGYINIRVGGRSKLCV